MRLIAVQASLQVGKHRREQLRFMGREELSMAQSERAWIDRPLVVPSNLQHAWLVRVGGLFYGSRISSVWSPY